MAMYPHKPLIFLAVSMLALYAGEALATCGFQIGKTVTSTTVTLPSLTISRNTPVGTVIYDSDWLGYGVSTTITCSGVGWVTLGFNPALNAVAGKPNVYETGVPGIGIKAAWSNTANTAYHPTDIDAVGNSGAWLVASPPKQLVQTGTGTNQTFTPAGIFRIQLLVTGPLGQSGTFSTPTVETAYHGLITNRAAFAGGGIQFTFGTCVVKDSAIAVDLPTLSITSLPNAGATAGATGFNLSVICESGVTVGYQIDGTTAPGTAASNGVLAIAGGAGQAAGVGIQIQDSAKAPVPLGSLVNSQLTSTFDGQLIQVPLTAYYYRTGTPVTAGAVKATATFTMSYL